MKWNDNIIDSLDWGKDIARRAEKEKVANRIAAMVEDNMTLGVGSGSTSYLALVKIAERVKQERLKIRAITTSLEIAMACARLEIPTAGLESGRPDWTFDGADEIDPNKHLIKGRGGAMFKEKLLINASPKTFILADHSKMVKRLGENFPVPVEVFPQALTYVANALQQELRPRCIKLRMAEGKDGPLITENGNLILDVWFDYIPAGTERAIKQITGVIESGLFMGYDIEVFLNS
ncbi:MAG: ribose 5-phosphate isomerase A [Tannerellaceae bacterium]|jgi:ribose 5-phosphate isomerase A|nr:ribose 5-phosphate isomerase A [Tannerellaceae bacterium]